MAKKTKPDESASDQESRLPVKLHTVPTLMTIEQLCAWLSVVPATVYGWVHRRQIPFHKIGPKELAHGGMRERDSRPLRFDYYEILDWTRTGTLPEWFIKDGGPKATTQRIRPCKATIT